MLSYAEIDRLAEGRLDDFWGGLARAMFYYEDLIDKGVLAVVKTAKRSSLKKVGPVSSGGDYLEHECGGLIHETQDNFCPECGTMIVDQ